jgi:YidC/Oxa1 family membrane protein insertase
MNKRKIQLLVLLVLVLGLTGCTKILKDDEGKAIQNKETGQNLTENILCRPESEDIKKIYEQNKIDISKLPQCSEFKVSDGGYEGIWTTVFVKPLAWLIVKVGNFFNSYGIAIIIVTLLLRTIAIPITKKTAVQSENMKIARPEIDKLEQKYKGRQDQESMMQKSQEMLQIYKKHNINPMSGCLFSFIQIPLFFAFYEAINRLPVLFEETFLGLFQLGTNPMKAISNGNYYYIIFIILVIGATYYSFKLNSVASMSKDQEKQMKMMTNIMIVFISIASFSLPTGIGLYWIFNSTFTIIQNLLVKRRKANGRNS